MNPRLVALGRRFRRTLNCAGGLADDIPVTTRTASTAAFPALVRYVEQSRTVTSAKKGTRVAKETITKLIDDLDGGEAQETVKFGLDGHSYEIDLSTKNANKLRSLFAPYLDVSTRVTGRGAAPARGGRARAAATGDRDQNKAIRAWAQRKGLPVAPRGRIKQEIVEQYHREAGR